jgi:hypothetical protein
MSLSEKDSKTIHVEGLFDTDQNSEGTQQTLNQEKHSVCNLVRIKFTSDVAIWLR